MYECSKRSQQVRKLKENQEKSYYATTNVCKIIVTRMISDKLTFCVMSGYNWSENGHLSVATLKSNGTIIM